MAQLNKVSTTEAVVNHFRQEIQSGALKPGDKLLSERELQAKFGISRFSLREGLARLNALGIIEVQHGKGAYVSRDLNPTSLQNVFVPLLSSQNLKTLQDLFDARVVIEREVAVGAALSRTDEDLTDLRTIVRESEAALADEARFGDLDFAFHRRIASVGRNVFFEKMADVLNEHVRLFLLDHAKDRESREEALAGHRHIVEMIESRDSTRIGQYIVDHIRGCKKSYERMMGIGSGDTGDL